jgi:hypothetical protein
VTVMVDGREERERQHVRSPVLRGVELTTASWRGVPPSPLLLSQMTLMLCDEGGGDVGWGRQVQPLTAGAVLVRAPQQVSVVMQRALPETSCRLVLVEPELLPGAGSQETRRLMRFGSVVTRSPPIVDGVRGLWMAIVDDAPPMVQQQQLSMLMSEIGRAHV